MTRLVTPRLVLRKPCPDDAGALHEAMSRPEVMRYWTRPAHQDRAETVAFLAAMIAGEADGADGADDFIIEWQGRVVGKAGMWRRFEVGFLLHPDAWGQGLAAEAMTAVIAHVFATHPDLPAITAEADPRNSACLRLLGRLGFAETGRAERTMQWGDEWCDSVYLRLPRPPG